MLASPGTVGQKLARIRQFSSEKLGGLRAISIEELLRTGRRLWNIELSVVAIVIIALAVRAHYTIPYKCVRQAEFTKTGLRGDEWALLEKLNRADRAHLSHLPKVILPGRWDESELKYSPLPKKFGAAKDVPKLIVVDACNQVFGAYEWGRLTRWGPVSTGQRGRPTPQGLFHLTWRSKQHYSTLDHSALRWYFNFEESRGLAFHQHPLPGEPASDGCVRLLERDARWLYQWGQPHPRTGQRVTVLIVGEYDFRKPPPWYSTRSSADMIKLPRTPLS